MPTTRPRHSVTETEQVTAALDAAAKRWPGEPRGQLLRRLIEMGAEALSDAEEQARDRLAQAVEATSGTLDDAYPAGYLSDLRREWPR